MQRLMKRAGVYTTVADQCMYGLTTWGSNGKEMKSAKKRTKFMSNAEMICKELQRRCDGRHEHQELVSGRAKDAARYPKEL